MTKKITYFLEDRRHEEFILALVERLAEEEGVTGSCQIEAVPRG